MLDDKVAFRPFFFDPPEARLDLREFVGGDDAAVGIGAGPGYAAGNILCVEDLIEGDRLVVLFEERVGIAWGSIASITNSLRSNVAA